MTVGVGRKSLGMSQSRVTARCKTGISISSCLKKEAYSNGLLNNKTSLDDLGTVEGWEGGMMQS